MEKKKDGFVGQWYIVLPDHIISGLNKNPLTKLLHITDIGYYPHALHHFRERKQGCTQHILIYCVGGKGIIHVNNEVKRLNKDQYFIIPVNQPHHYYASSNEPWSIYWVHFAGSHAGFFVDTQLRIKYLDPTKPRYKDRIMFFDEIFQILSMGYTNENLEYSSICLWQMLGSFNYLSLFQRTREFANRGLVEKSIQFMHENLDKKITLSDLAGSCNLSIPQFCKLFKRKTSQSPIDYFIRLKIQKSCQYLDFSELKVHEIASELAFEDPFYFSRLFKKVMGVSPYHFRNRSDH